MTRRIALNKVREMAAGSSSSSMLFLGMKGGEDDQVNPQLQDLESVPPNSLIPISQPQATPSKKRRNRPGMLIIPDAEIIQLSPTTLMATNRFTCEVCHKGFQREQNLQLHRRGHDLPWQLKQKTEEPARRKVYLCPETSCVHHDPSRALGDLTGIKKHFSRKHGEKKFKCDKCSKMYAVECDLKAHSKTCGTKEYKCDCGTLFSRRDSFNSHRAFCDALSQVASNLQPPSFTSMPAASLYGNGSRNRSNDNGNNNMISSMGLSQMAGSHQIHHPTRTHGPLYPSAAANQLSYLRADNNLVFGPSMGLSRYKPVAPAFLIPTADQQHQHDQFLGDFHSGFFDNPMNINASLLSGGSGMLSDHSGSLYLQPHVHNNSPHLSATALLQKAGLLGSTSSHNNAPTHMLEGYASSSSSGSFGPFGGGTKSEDGSLGLHFGMADNNGQNNNNMDELLNSFTSNGGVRPGVIVEERHQALPPQNLRAGGLTLMRDFLGVEPGEIVRSISSSSNKRGPQRACGGESFL